MKMNASTRQREPQRDSNGTSRLRLFDIKIFADKDPGKVKKDLKESQDHSTFSLKPLKFFHQDDFGVHQELIAAVSKRLMCERLKADCITLGIRGAFSSEG